MGLGGIRVIRRKGVAICSLDVVDEDGAVCMGDHEIGGGIFSCQPSDGGTWGAGDTATFVEPTVAVREWVWCGSWTDDQYT
jgi:hypothetical protein